MTFACPHCGWRYSAIVENARRRNKTAFELVPYHDWPKPTRQVCPGACRPPVRVNERTRSPAPEDDPVSNRTVSGTISQIQYTKHTGVTRVVLADSRHLEYRITDLAKITIDGKAERDPGEIQPWLALAESDNGVPSAELTIDVNGVVVAAAFDCKPRPGPA